MRIDARRLRTVEYYLGVVGYYCLIVFAAMWLNNVLGLPAFVLPLRMFGLVLAALGGLLMAWSCWLQFTAGQGTTGFSEPTTKLVTCGPYKVVRNPMMHGQFLVFAGLGFLLDLGAMFLLLPLVILAMHGVIVYVEEPDLKRRFGQEWEDYAERVPRWFPRLGLKRRFPGPAPGVTRDRPRQR